MSAGGGEPKPRSNAFKEATDGRIMNYAELFTTLQRVVYIINGRPIGVRALDDEVVVPVTFNMLLLGKTYSAPDLSNS